MSRNAAQTPTYTSDNFSSNIPQVAEVLMDYGIIAVHLKLGVTFATTDSFALYTVPAGKQLRILQPYYKITTSFTGGTASAIGLSSDDTDYNTPGDILGGAAGDLAATLVSTGRGYKSATQGTKFGSNATVVIGPGKSLIFNRIASIFTAGVAAIHVDGFWVDS